MKSLITLLSLLLLVAACKKDDAKVLTRTEMFTSGPWKQIAGTSTKQSDGSVIDVYTGLQACKKDDEFIFLADKTFQQTEGASKCDPSHPQLSFTGTWSFSGNEDLLTVVSGTSGFSARILELTATTLKMENTAGGYIVTVSYRH